jgi:small neutral amino acid transporter SnatA (MarC family)
MGHQSLKKAEWSNKHKLRAVAIVLITCACGWFVMELEILGVRVLAPYFGSSVYVVTGSVIGVFLLSLSAGYMLGGWLSTKANSQYVLGINLMAAGVWLCSMPFFADAVCNGMFNIGLDEKWGSLLAALVLFGAPTMLLGTVSPTAVYWLTTQASDSGLKAGLVLAFSTIASFAGCVVTAFYLVLLSMQHTIRASGVVLLALGGTILLRAAAQGTKNPSSKTGKKTEEKIPESQPDPRQEEV